MAPHALIGFRTTWKNIASLVAEELGATNRELVWIVGMTINPTLDVWERACLLKDEVGCKGWRLRVFGLIRSRRSLGGWRMMCDYHNAFGAESLFRINRLDLPFQPSHIVQMACVMLFNRPVLDFLKIFDLAPHNLLRFQRNVWIERAAQDRARPNVESSLL